MAKVHVMGEVQVVVKGDLAILMVGDQESDTLTILALPESEVAKALDIFRTENSLAPLCDADGKTKAEFLAQASWAGALAQLHGWQVLAHIALDLSGTNGSVESLQTAWGEFYGN